MAASPKFILASASTTRQKLLIDAGFSPVIHPSQFDEATITAQDPALLVQQLALAKAKAVAHHYAAKSPTQAVILGCDSVLALQDQVYGKPANPEEAIARWQRMRGQVGTLLTGHALIDLAKPQTVVHHRATHIKFAVVSDRQIEAYVQSGEPLHCAGGFTLEGRGSAFIESVSGCYSNVLGLSMSLLREMLATVGYDFIDFWDPWGPGEPQ